MSVFAIYEFNIDFPRWPITDIIRIFCQTEFVFIRINIYPLKSWILWLLLFSYSHKYTDPFLHGPIKMYCDFCLALKESFNLKLQALLSFHFPSCGVSKAFRGVGGTNVKEFTNNWSQELALFNVHLVSVSKFLLLDCISFGNFIFTTAF